MSATKGWRGKLRIADTEAGLDTASDEPYIDRVETNIDGGLEALYQLGSRLPQEINEGNVSMSLTITKKLVDGTWAGYAGIGQTDMIPPTKYIGVYPFGYGTGKLKIVCKGKFTSWRYSGPQPDYAVETLEFVVESITVGTV
jgi:hypothetical protein